MQDMMVERCAQLGQASTHGGANQPENRRKQAKQSPIGIETVQPEQIGPGRALLALVAQSFPRASFVLFTYWLHLLRARESLNNAHSDPFEAQQVMA